MADNNGNADAAEAGNNRENVAPNGIQINARDRLFHAIFIKAAAVYIRVCPKWCRALLEVVILVKALVLFTTLSYIHFTFSKNPMDCLEKYHNDWPKDGILQVQILKNQVKLAKQSQLPPFFASKWNHSFVVGDTMNRSTTVKDGQCPLEQKHTGRISHEVELKDNDMDPVFVDTVIDEGYLLKRETVFYEKKMQTTQINRYPLYSSYFPSIQQLIHFYANKQLKNYYVMEYALEYGFLRLSQETRRKLNISVKVVTLDPKSDKCFGDSLSRFILDKLLGYDDLLMASIKKLAEREGNRGYMKNVLSGEHYKFVTMWMGRTSYAVSFLLMFVFTISISTLLRFCHQQIFIFIVHLLHVMDWNVSLTFPVAPLFTVILSLVGMEAIMAEFFNDTTTSFYVILIVWAADQFDSICCHTRLSQKYWLRFFYLYHFLFYAYHYRFNGQYSTIALAASWFFIQHSMLYFLHNYEIPAIEAEINARGANYLDDAVDLLVDDFQFPPQPENNIAMHNEEPQNDGGTQTQQDDAIISVNLNDVEIENGVVLDTETADLVSLNVADAQNTIHDGSETMHDGAEIYFETDIDATEIDLDSMGERTRYVPGHTAEDNTDGPSVSTNSGMFGQRLFRCGTIYASEPIHLCWNYSMDTENREEGLSPSEDVSQRNGIAVDGEVRNSFNTAIRGSESLNETVENQSVSHRNAATPKGSTETEDKPSSEQGDFTEHNSNTQTVVKPSSSNYLVDK